MSYKEEQDQMSNYSDDSNDSSDRESVHESQSKPKGAAMMSLLSFYGIQEESAKDKSSLDSPCFDSNTYVKNLLSEAPMEELLHRDTQLVQEIRTLDSDMQMLVYENYNKFISATETIKRMKINVEVMDEDMNEVKQKMDQICKVSLNLDETVREQRSKEMIAKEAYHKAVILYNKTINVLTKHSGVLSLKNIKERTESMMKELRAKVTNLLDDPLLDTTKLTQHVTVLRMMQAPKPLVVQKLIAAHMSRSRLMIKSFQASEGLESVPSSVGLTVSRTRKFHQSLIAGLIEACKGINELFCNSEHLVTDSNQSSSLNNEPKEANHRLLADLDFVDHEAAHKSLVGAVQDVVSNYSLIMINQLKAFFQEYRAKAEELRLLEKKLKSLSVQDSHEQSIINETSREPTEKEVLDRNIRLLQLTVYQIEDECQNWYLLARQAILDLLYLETSVRDCSPSNNSHRLRRMSQGHLDSNSSDGKSDSLVSFAKSFAIDILTVISQQIDYLFWKRMLGFAPLVVSFTQSLCKLSDLTNGFNPSMSSGAGHGTDYGHSRSDYHGSLDAMSSHGLSTSSHPSSDPLGIRHEIQKRMNEGKNIMDKLFDSLVAVFVDIVTEIKPILDVYNTVLPSKSSKSHQSASSASIVSSSIPNHVNGFQFVVSVSGTGLTRYSSGVSETERNIIANVLGVNLAAIISSIIGSDPTHLTHDYVMHLLWSFICALTQITEIISNVTYPERCFAANSGSFVCPNDDGITVSESVGRVLIFSGTEEPQDDTIKAVIAGLWGGTTAVGLDGLFREFLLSVNELNTPTLQSNTGVQSSQDQIEMTQRQVSGFVVSAFMSNISSTLLRRLDAELKNIEGTHLHVPKDSVFKAKCAARLELSSQESLKSSIESISEIAKSLSTIMTNDLVKSVRFASPSITTIEELAIDGNAVTCCVILGEAPPPSRTASYLGGSATQSNQTSRRTIARPTMMSSGGNVHMDIERLFSQKIQIYSFYPNRPTASVSQPLLPSNTAENRVIASSSEVIVGIIAKAALKTIHEHIRFLTIPHMLYLELQIHVNVLKQVAASLLKESTEIEGLVDQLNNSMFSRYTDASNISHYIGAAASGGSHQDGSDAVVITRMTTQALQDISKSAYLIPKFT